jgi:hypothetical protein
MPGPSSTAAGRCSRMRPPGGCGGVRSHFDGCISVSGDCREPRPAGRAVDTGLGRSLDSSLTIVVRPLAYARGSPHGPGIRNVPYFDSAIACGRRLWYNLSPVARGPDSCGAQGSNHDDTSEDHAARRREGEGNPPGRPVGDLPWRTCPNYAEELPGRTIESPLPAVGWVCCRQTAPKRCMKLRRHVSSSRNPSNTPNGGWERGVIQ